MLKSFFKTKRISNSIEEGFKTRLTDDEIVKQIHNEVDSLHDSTNQAINKMLEDLKIPTENQINRKGDLMKDLGFGSKNETIQQSEKIREEIKEKERVKELNQKKLQLMNEYRLAYPADKIIPFEDFEKVLDKYKLIFAPVDAYIKDVPEKNLLEIKNAKSVDYNHKPDLVYTLTNISIVEGWSKNENIIKYLTRNLPKLSPILIKQKEVVEYYKTYIVEDPKNPITTNLWGLFLDSKGKRLDIDLIKCSYSEYSRALEEGYLTHKKVNKEKPSSIDIKCVIFNALNNIEKHNFKQDSFYEHLRIDEYKDICRVDRSKLFIAAPKSHFDLSQLSTWDGKEYFEKVAVKISHITIPDPIAFKILKGLSSEDKGFVRIITKWGTSDDQSYLDPIVQDERMN